MKRKGLLILFMLIFTVSVCSPVFASTKSGGPWYKPILVWFGDEIISTGWSFDYRGDYYDSGSNQIVNNHHSGGCIDPAPGGALVANYLTYKINGTNTNVYFDTNEAALCNSPKTAYEYSKYNYNITWNPYTDTMSTIVSSHWNDNYCDPSDVYVTGTVNW